MLGVERFLNPRGILFAPNDEARDALEDVPEDKICMVGTGEEGNPVIFYKRVKGAWEKMEKPPLRTYTSRNRE